MFRLRSKKDPHGNNGCMNTHYRTYSAISRASLHKSSLNWGQFEAVKVVSAYSRVFLIQKISQRNKVATNEHVLIEKDHLGDWSPEKDLLLTDVSTTCAEAILESSGSVSQLKIQKA